MNPAYVALPTFRPAIIIFLGAEGEQVYHTFDDLMAGLDARLLEGVVAIHLDDTASAAHIAPLLAPPDADANITHEPLAVVLEQALTRVQDARVKENIELAEYTVPIQRAQIIIVGSSRNVFLHTVVTPAVQGTLENFLASRGVSANGETLITYILNNPEVPKRYDPAQGVLQGQPGLTEDDILAAGAGGAAVPDVVAFAPITRLGRSDQYKTMANGVANPGPTPVRQMQLELRYALAQQGGGTYTEPRRLYLMAEAVFALVATGVTETQPYMSVASASSVGSRPSAVGSLGVAMVRFPRAQAEAYCFSRDIADLLNDWASEAAQNPKMNQRIQEDRARSAQRLMQVTIIPWLQRFPQRPPASSPLDSMPAWPDPSKLPGETRRALRALELAQRRIDTALNVDTVHERVHRFQRTAPRVDRERIWHDQVDIAFETARDHYALWATAAQDAWRRVEEEIRSEIGLVTNELLLRDQQSWIEAQAYVQALDDAIQELGDQISYWRVQTSDEYRYRIDEYARLANDPRWANVQQTVIGANGATPLASPGLAGGVNPPAAPAGAATPAAQPQPAGGPPMERMELISLQLANRVRYLQAHLPSRATLAVAAVASGAPLAALTNIELPVGLANTPLGAALSIGAAAVFLGVGGGLYRKFDLRQVAQARRDQVEFLALRIQAQRAQREAQLRAAVVTRLRYAIRQMRERLENWAQQLERIRNQSNTQARQTSQSFFDSPAGVHDIIVANGVQLRRPPLLIGRELEPIYTVFRTQRLTHPRERWHATNAEINERLRQRFRELGAGVLFMSEDKFLATIRAFWRDAFLAYLGREVAQIGPALDPQHNVDARDMWDEATTHAEPMYGSPGHDIPYVSADLANMRALDRLGKAAGSRRLLTQSEEWALVAKLRRE
ncbi:MAG TPA: hypothetical protein VMV29_00165 [Ktedonobacterales bacterium]|nr:hypothetical protein [Ktedonobacterales bacterium]